MGVQRYLKLVNQYVVESKILNHTFLMDAVKTAADQLTHSSRIKEKTKKPRNGHAT